MPAMRDRSVVRSSVIASAKYCWSGSLLRFVKGSTTIDRRGATAGFGIKGVAAAATTAGKVGEDLVVGQIHQVTSAIRSTANGAATIAARAVRRRRSGALGAGRSATASGR